MAYPRRFFRGGPPAAMASAPTSHGASTCPGGCDPALRPIAPTLFCTDISNANNNSGDWQLGGTGFRPDFVSGTWKSATTVVNGSGVPTTTVDADPKVKNHWVLGPGFDTPSVGFAALQDEGYGAEVRWNVNSPNIQCKDAVTGTYAALQAGHVYRIQILIHDGDQNGTGGDAGQACAIIAR